jgi:hypothetical protein
MVMAVPWPPEDGRAGFQLGQVGRARTLRACANPSRKNLAIPYKRSARIEVPLYPVPLQSAPWETARTYIALFETT